MKKTMMVSSLVVASIAMVSCGSHYVMSDISRSRIVIDKRYDGSPDAAAMNYLAPFSHKVDSMMSPVVGRVARYMMSRRPESALSNLLSDVLVSAGRAYNEQPAFGVYNMGGIRAALAEGDVRVGDVLNVAPFENKICFLTLSGDKVMQLFRQIAMRGGEGVSRGVELEMTNDGRLVKAMVHGRPIDESQSYRVVTLDYLAQGNDQLTAFKGGTDVNSPKDKDSNVRDLIVRYFREATAKGEVVDREVEGRIKIVEQ